MLSLIFQLFTVLLFAYVSSALLSTIMLAMGINSFVVIILGLLYGFFVIPKIFKWITSND